MLELLATSANVATHDQASKNHGSGKKIECLVRIAKVNPSLVILPFSRRIFIDLDVEPSFQRHAIAGNDAAVRDWHGGQSCNSAPRETGFENGLLYYHFEYFARSSAKFP